KLHLLRQWSKRAHDLFLQNLVKGTTHLSLGQEAVATGFSTAMRPDDYTFATYRGHAHSLSRGMDPGEALAELLGRSNGVLGGNTPSREHPPTGTGTARPGPAADRAPAYGLGPIVVDGNDPDAVYLTAKAAIDKARSGGGPSLIEAQTYRHGGHSRADPGKYRPAEEIEAWKGRDPIPTYHDRLLTLGTPEETLPGIEREVAGDVGAATEFAKRGPEPGEAELFRNVWADGGAEWRN